MFDDGRLKNTSHPDIWEISEKGRAWLKKNVFSCMLSPNSPKP
jgi:hypothetical protein